MLIERHADAAEGKPAVSDILRYRYEDIRESYISTLKLKKRVSLYSHTDENGQPNVTFRGLDHFNKCFKNMLCWRPKLILTRSANIPNGEAVRVKPTQLSGVSSSPYAPCSDWLREKKRYSACRIFRCQRIPMPPDSTSNRHNFPHC